MDRVAPGLLLLVTAPRNHFPVMIRNISIFLAMFVVGALIAFGTRAARHKPDTTVHQHTAREHEPMVGNALTATPVGATSRTETNRQSEAGTAKAPPDASAADHSGHGMAKPASATEGTVNSVCAICGMKVDPSLPTLEYKGKKVGFGCKMCAPKFKADPDKYGPMYLKNEVIKR